MIARIVIVLIFVIPLTVIWVTSIDKAVNDEAWDRQRKKDKQEEDKAQIEYLRRYNERKKAKRLKKEHKRTIKQRLVEIMADTVTVVCTSITNFLLRIQKRGKK